MSLYHRHFLWVMIRYGYMDNVIPAAVVTVKVNYSDMYTNVLLNSKRHCSLGMIDATNMVPSNFLELL